MNPMTSWKAFQIVGVLRAVLMSQEGKVVLDTILDNFDNHENAILRGMARTIRAILDIPDFPDSK